jgi:hypothetical protein
MVEPFLGDRYDGEFAPTTEAIFYGNHGTGGSQTRNR